MLSKAHIAALAARATTRHDWIGEACRPDQDETSGPYRRTPDFRVSTTDPDAKAMRKRQVWVEPLFAEAKEWHGLRRFRLRGLENANMQAQLIAAGQNLMRLLSRWGWGGAHGRAGQPEWCSRQ